MSMVAIKIEPLIFWKQLALQNNVCVDCIISPLGGDKWLLENVFVIESFIRDSFKNTDSSINEQVRYEWVIESLIQTNFHHFNSKSWCIKYTIF